MKRSRKLIALLCSLAMVFSLFANLTIVSANAQGIELSLDASSTATEKIVKAKYVGMDKGIASFGMEFNVPEGATVQTVTNLGAPTDNLNGTTYKVGAMSVANVAAEDGVFATMTITLAAELTEDFSIDLLDSTAISDEDGNEYTVKAGTLGVAPLVFEATAKPVATPIPDDQPITEGQGIELSVDASSTDTVKVIKAKYVGMDKGIASFGMEFNVPEGATVQTVTGLGTPTDNLNGTTYKVGAMAVSNVASEDGVFATMTITLASELTEDFVITLLDSTAISDEDGNEYTVKAGTLKTTYAVLRAPEAPVVTEPPVDETPTPTPSVEPVDPTATPEPADERPTPIPTATPEVTEPPAEPTATPIPDDQPITEGQGIELSVDASSTDTVKVIKAKYVGMDNGIASFGMEFNVPEGATVQTVTGLGTPTDNLNGATYKVGAMAVSNVASEDGVFATMTITLASELTEDFMITLLDSTAISDEDGNEYTVKAGTLKTTYAVLRAPEAPVVTEPPVEPTATPTAEPEVVKEVALKDLVDPELATDDAYVTIATDGVYGTDYVAKDSEGNVLTEAEFFNKIWGYDGAVKDVINDLTLVIYDEDTEIKVSLNADGIKVDTGSTAPEEEEPTVTPAPGKKATISWSKTSVNVTKGSKVNMSVTVKNPPEDYTIEYVIEDDDNCITVEVNEKDQKKITIEGDKVGAAYIVAVIKDADGNVVAESAKLKVNVRSASTPGTGGSSGTGSGSIGTIAGSQQPTGNGGLWRPDGNIAVNFTDLGQAAWAADAINYLAARGIVNGRSATIFDPNANITRAEFTKLVLTVYGITPPADAFTASSYSDVNISAWYGAYIEAGSMLGIVTGYPDGTFRPDALVSRQEMALMMYRAANMRGTVLPTVNAATAWADAAMIGDWAAEAVTALNVAGIMNGTSATTFEPTAAATRAQAAQMIYNLYTVTQ